MDRKIISVHLPKAGGSSLKHQLEVLFGSRLLLDYGAPPLACDAEIRVDALPPGIDVVHGHFHAARYNAIPDAFRFTFLRHPVQNLISIYFFWLQYPPSGVFWHEKFLREKPSLLQFADYAPLTRLLTVSYFGGFDMRMMDFVGFHEHRADDLKNLGSMIGHKIEDDVYVNKTPFSGIREEMMSDGRLLTQLEDILREDVSFFEENLRRRK